MIYHKVEENQAQNVKSITYVTLIKIYIVTLQHKINQRVAVS